MKLPRPAYGPLLAALLVCLVAGCGDGGGPGEGPGGGALADTGGDAGGGQAREPSAAFAATDDLPDPEPSEELERRLRPLRAAVDRDPDDAQARRRLATALHDSGLEHEALIHFEKAAQLEPTVRSLLDLGIAYGSVARFAEAERTYGRLLELEPEYPIALHNLGNIAFKRGENENAIELYRRAIAADPRYMLAYYHMGEALARAGRYKEAYRTYEQVLGLEPSNAEELAVLDDALYGLASLDIAMGAHARAEELLAALLRANPEHERANYAYGQVLLQLGRPEEAQRAFEAHMRIQAKLKPKGPVAMGE